MGTDPTPVVAALANLSDAELHALMDTTYKVPQIAPGLLAWLEGACDRELNRRCGFDYTLQPPEAAIDPSEDEVSINVAMAIRAAFAQDDRPEARAVLTFLDAVHGVLTGDGARH